MEIYGQSRQEVEYAVPPGATGVSVFARLNDGPEKELTITNDSINNPLKKAIVPFTNTEGILRVYWRFTIETFATLPETVEVVQVYDVVTPILEKSEILKVHPNATDEEITSVEKATRHIIMAHTGQKFGKYTGPQKVRSTGGVSLRLPQKLIRLDKFNGVESHNLYLDPTGWVLSGLKHNPPVIKADSDGWHVHTGGVIHDPNSVAYRTFKEGNTYVVDGEWGWESVPSAVREAAKLLVNDYACANAGYRDRYLTSMTAADWRIQFHSGAFDQTGNVRADQLLREFVLKRGWAVL